MNMKYDYLDKERVSACVSEATFNRFYHLYGDKLQGVGVGKKDDEYIIHIYIKDKNYKVEGCDTSVTLQIDGEIVDISVEYIFIGDEGFIESNL